METGTKGEAKRSREFSSWFKVHQLFHRIIGLFNSKCGELFRLFTLYSLAEAYSIISEALLKLTISQKFFIWKDSDTSWNLLNGTVILVVCSLKVCL